MPALIFDCDGVLADTERDGHLPAFNATFDHFGLPAHWTVQDYAALLKIGGGKERMATLFDNEKFCEAAGVPESAEQRQELLSELHRFKTGYFRELIRTGSLPPRPGVVRVIREASDSGWTVAVASTSAQESVRAVLEHAVGPLSSKIPVYAGDVVAAKKPDPAIYRLTVEDLGLDRETTLVIEDSRNGLLAATGAGLKCLVTVSGYTRDEDFSEASAVVSELGDPDRYPIEVLADDAGIDPRPFVTLAHLANCMPGERRARGDATTIDV